jgi:hypothetical protein
VSLPDARDRLYVRKTVRERIDPGLSQGLQLLAARGEYVARFVD